VRPAPRCGPAPLHRERAEPYLRRHMLDQERPREARRVVAIERHRPPRCSARSLLGDAGGEHEDGLPPDRLHLLLIEPLHGAPDRGQHDEERDPPGDPRPREQHAQPVEPHVAEGVREDVAPHGQLARSDSDGATRAACHAGPTPETTPTTVVTITASTTTRGTMTGTGMTSAGSRPT